MEGRDAKPFAQSSPQNEAGDKLWGSYLDTVALEDDASMKRWTGSTDGLLTFTGIFAATVATFLVESYQQLQPDTSAQAIYVGNQTVALLAQLVSANSPTSAVPNPDTSLNPFEFTPPRSAIVINSLWFLSLVISLICTLLATLVQEWTRDFERSIGHRSLEITIQECAFNHVYQRMGVDRYGLDRMTSVIVGLIHVAVVLFLVGLCIFLSPIHHVPAWVVIVASSVAALFYIVASIVPVFEHACPYRTWLTPVFSRLTWFTYTVALSPKLLSWMRNLEPADGDRKWLPVVRALWGHTYELFDPNVDFVFLKNVPRILRDMPQLKSRARGWDTFITSDESRLVFIWRKIQGYLSQDPENHKDVVPALLEHFISLVPETPQRVMIDFMIDLRHRRVFMDLLADRISSVDSVSSAVGSLKLLRLLITADSDHGGNVYDVSGGRWEAMKDTVFRPGTFNFAFVSRLDSINKFALASSANPEVLIEVFKLRCTLLRLRTELFRRMSLSATADVEKRHHSAINKTRASEVMLVDELLLALNEAESFRLLHWAVPLETTDDDELSRLKKFHEERAAIQQIEGLSRIDTEKRINDAARQVKASAWRMELARNLNDHSNMTVSYQLTVQNLLTLLSGLICSYQAAQSRIDHTKLPNPLDHRPFRDTPESLATHSFIRDQLAYLAKLRIEHKNEIHEERRWLPSGIFLYLRSRALDALHLAPQINSNTYQIASTETSSGGDRLRIIAELLTEVAQRIIWPDIPQSETTEKMQKQGGELLSELGILTVFKQEDYPPPTIIIPQHVSLTTPQLAKLGLGLNLIRTQNRREYVDQQATEVSLTGSELKLLGVTCSVNA